jgi:hypothetical protein
VKEDRSGPLFEKANVDPSPKIAYKPFSFNGQASGYDKQYMALS